MGEKQRQKRSSDDKGEEYSEGEERGKLVHC